MASNPAANVIPPEVARKEVPSPGRDLYLAVCAGLLKPPLGMRFAPWCRSVGIDEQRTRAALYGISSTEEAVELRAKAMRAAGLIGDGGTES